jgi:hypothetical protein
LNPLVRNVLIFLPHKKYFDLLIENSREEIEAISKKDKRNILHESKKKR